MYAGCAGKTVRSLENVCHTYLSALEVCSWQGAIQIHIYLYLLPLDTWVTPDPSRRQPYWYHPCVVRSRWSVIPVAVARAWNALPQHVRKAPSLSVFRRELKTVLFRSSFPDAIWQCTVLYLRARLSVLICHHVVAATNWFCWHCTVVLQQQCNNAS